MGRKAYSDDLATAKILEVANVRNVKSGEDGEFSFDFHSRSLGRSVLITAMISDTSEYPNGHDYYIFAADDAPPAISNAVQSASNTAGKRVPQLLSHLSSCLTAAVASGSQNDPIALDGDNDTDLLTSKLHEEDDDDDDELDTWDFGDDDYQVETAAGVRKPLPGAALPGSTVDLQLIRQDLLAAKNTGFKVGVCGNPSQDTTCVVNISCRVSKLNISDEAMQAWSIKPDEYLILMLYYPAGYRRLELVQSASRINAATQVQFGVALSSHYKPSSLAEAIAFLKSGTTETLRETFIGKPLHALFNERFLAILAFRLSEGLSWTGAEALYNDSLGFTKDAARPLDIYRTMADGKRSGFVGVLTEDELYSGKGPSDLSLPLIAMQFLLRHFCGCTWFCLVCHCKTTSAIEAIKPYVCDKPLCLYQYMNLGLGPSIDHEVTSQPLVVDLLVSFCYTAASANKIREYPELDWKVLHPLGQIYGTNQISQQMAMPHWPGQQGQLSIPRPNEAKPLPDPIAYTATFDRLAMELIFPKGQTCPVTVGDWIVIPMPDEHSSWHLRVNSTSFFPTVALSQQPVVSTNSAIPNDPLPRPGPTLPHCEKSRVSFMKYDVGFDELSRDQKGVSICRLLDTMPKISEMKAYLQGGKGRQLETWKERLSPAHSGLLRWIVASNRSCIMQVDEVAKDDSGNIRLGVRANEERVSGLGNWLQFRFAMGSPDKEARFVRSLIHGNPQYPSMFAWHGSSFNNWHSIIRSGLDFQDTVHGRAFGNGVYHSPDWNTSMSYSGGGRCGPFSSWPQSLLSVNNAIALSEIVNAPSKFQSASPHYVVQHTDWIQTRYLFAQPGDLNRITFGAEVNVAHPLPQDPAATAWGPNRKRIELPATAIPRARRLKMPVASRSPWEPPKAPKRKHGQDRIADMVSAFKPKSRRAGVTVGEPIDLDEDDNASIATLDEDLEILGRSKAYIMRPPTPPPMPVTPFTPGPIGNPPMMPAPTYATRSASMALQKAYKQLLNTQEEHLNRGKLAELGWYVDSDHINKTENLYQWVICMHSFPLDLPLGQQMKSNNIESIVFELRFPANFAFSPPFIRVIRPRFLPYAMGGGGHVTAGGSICMDLLTASGWNVATSIESVLLNIRMAIMTTDPRPAQLEQSFSAGRGQGGRFPFQGSEYGVREAVEAYVRACRAHGWVVPPELSQMTAGDGRPGF